MKTLMTLYQMTVEGYRVNRELMEIYNGTIRERLDEMPIVTWTSYPDSSKPKPKVDWHKEGF